MVANWPLVLRNTIKQKFKKLNPAEICVFGSIFLFIVLKFVLITTFAPDIPTFLFSYKFVTSDSYDWIANGLRLFDNDSISFRNPGLPLIVRLLSLLRMPYLLPLLSNLAFFGLIVYIYKLTRLKTSRAVALVLAIFMILNYPLNLAANYIWADMYAVVLIAGSLYYLLTNKALLSICLLGLSLLFQNLGYFLLPIWLSYLIFQNFPKLKKKLLGRNLIYFARLGLWSTLVLAPILLWSVYKFIKFGNPLYDGIGQLALIQPNLGSTAFYLICSLGMFGFIIIPFIAHSLLDVRNIIKDRLSLVLWSGLILNALFWFVLYDWDDSRFLLYFTPFLYPLLGYFLIRVWKKSYLGFALALLLIYPTVLPTGSTFKELAVLPSLYLRVDPNDTNRYSETSIQRKPVLANPVLYLNPTLYSLFRNYSKNHTPGSTWYSSYTNYINAKFNRAENSICIDKSQGIRIYILRSTLLINSNIDTKKVKFYDCAPSL